jgi:hypothetical protein
MQTYYQLLDLEPNSTSREIKHQYRIIVGAYHGAGHHVPSDIKTAYETLGNPGLRAEYDRNLCLKNTKSIVVPSSTNSLLSLIKEPVKLLVDCYTEQPTGIIPNKIKQQQPPIARNNTQHAELSTRLEELLAQQDAIVWEIRRIRRKLSRLESTS